MTTRPPVSIPHDRLKWLLAAMALVIAPHALELPVWLTVSVLACGGLRYLLSLRGDALPGRLTRLLAVITATSAIYVTYGTILGLDAGVALLSLMAGFKFLELRGARDALVILLLGYFLVASYFLFDQSLFAAGYALAAAWALTTLLITTQGATDGSPVNAHARLGGIMLLQAVPLMVLLFVLFPRIQGPLWGMPEDAYAAMTGLSDEMTPGSISDLSQSGDAAFRVEFADGPPPRAQRYWRGPVLGGYDGATWTQTRLPDQDGTEVRALSEPSAYVVTLEPHNQPWLLTLDIATSVDHPAQFDGAHQLRKDEPLRERIRYEARSTLHYQLGRTLGDDERERHVALPDDAHPQARELAREWQDASGGDRGVVERGLRHFASEPFSYTLQPPLLEEDSVDEFLFDTRAGFCEHYAGAFAVLMRAADIPARVVTGYLGGRMNPAGDYMIVRQSDAHAWVEVWLEGEGWTRVDPTAQVAPDRVELGLAEALPDGDPAPGGAASGDGLVGSLSLRWDAVNAYWNRWVLAYGPTLQDNVLERLNLGSWQRLVIALTGAMALLLGSLTALLLYRSRPRSPDPAVRAWQRFRRRAARAGLDAPASEGPHDFGQRAAHRWPDQAALIDMIVTHYLHLRYGRRQHPEDLTALRRAVRRFRPSRPGGARGRRRETGSQAG
ncbi:transglutaminase TgpA family protein [Aquisalimonas asiatica]|uniref:Transglutaminase-like domain-containing protein n=1 Tax=Aquisalimonas asiatica TaxID=406100 RepID=A0A1H8QPT1_9GAMM|nr:DUF3488 and transglutaminase-like domain-containing protein [Aquisalimonas asiatica]SEO56001.1 protein of unknown function [Aquisalimonas asiatica]